VASAVSATWMGGSFSVSAGGGGAAAGSGLMLIS
jgi:hypothetical protein